MLNYILFLFKKNKKEKCLTCGLVKVKHYWDYENSVPTCPCCRANPLVEDFYPPRRTDSPDDKEKGNWKINPQFMERFRKDYN